MRTIPIAALAAVFLVAAVPAMAADAAKEIAVAAAHANLATQAKSLAGIHLHLHHAVNCLVGPGGDGFDDKELNPCGGMGDGAIPDTADAAKKKLLQDALAKAEEGLAETDPYAAAKAAGEVQGILKQAM